MELEVQRSMIANPKALRVHIHARAITRQLHSAACRPDSMRIYYLHEPKLPQAPGWT